MFDHVCGEEPGNMSSFPPLARQACASWASAQCDRGFPSLSLPSLHHPHLALSFPFLSTRSTFGGECYSSSTVEMCWGPAKTSWNAPTVVCRPDQVELNFLGRSGIFSPLFIGVTTELSSRRFQSRASRDGSLDHLGNVLKLLSIHWVRSLFCSAAGCGELIFKQRVCRIQEGQQQPAGTL